MTATDAGTHTFTIERDTANPAVWDASVDDRVVHTFKIGRVTTASRADVGVESRMSDATLPPTAFTNVQVQTGFGWTGTVPHWLQADPPAFRVQPAGGADFAVSADSPGGGVWHPITSVRVADTRTGLGYPKGPFTGLNLNPNGVLTVTGTGKVPATATAVMADVTVTDATQPTSVNVAPPVYSTAQKDQTAISIRPGQTETAAVMVDLTDSNSLQVTVDRGTASVIVDLVGYASPALTYGDPTGDRLQPLPPRALLSGPVPGADPRVLTLPIGPVDGAEPDSALLTVTATRPGKTGFLSVGPMADPTSPPTAAMTVDRGQTVTSQILAPVVHGTVQLVEHTGGLADLQVVQTGAMLPMTTLYTSAPLFYGTGMARIFDTRQGGHGSVAAGGTLSDHVTATEPTDVTPATEVPPSGVAAVWVSLTATATATGAARATTITVPSAADTAVQVPVLQVPAGGTVSGLALIPVDAAGNITLRSTGAAVQLIGDLEGYQATSPTAYCTLRTDPRRQLPSGAAPRTFGQVCLPS